MRRLCERRFFMEEVMEEYKKVTISFTKDQLEKLDEIISKEQGYSRSSLVREAVDYYLGYLAQKGSVSYLSPIISQNIKKLYGYLPRKLKRLVDFALHEFAKVSDLAEIYYVKRDTTRLAGLTDNFNM